MFCLLVCQISTSAPSCRRSVRSEPAPTRREASSACALRASSSLPPDADVWVIICDTGRAVFLTCAALRAPHVSVGWAGPRPRPGSGSSLCSHRSDDLTFLCNKISFTDSLKPKQTSSAERKERICCWFNSCQQF